MIIHHAHGLHKGIADRRPDKGESSFLQIFAHGIGLGGIRRNFMYIVPCVLHGFTIDETPDIRIKTAELLLHFQKRPGVRHH